jgi:threonine dehydrogenase-like Zn-dependent dehydrogenase
MQAKAAVLYEVGTPLRFEEVEVLPPQRGEVQVRMYAGGVCHSDLHVMKGDLVMPMPIILGHEGSGIVECVGEGVTSVQPGDHVIPIWRVSCGICEYCTGGRPALCDVGDPDARHWPDARRYHPLSSQQYTGTALCRGLNLCAAVDHARSGRPQDSAPLSTGEGRAAWMRGDHRGGGGGQRR